MKARYFFIDFINFIFLLALIVFCILYFIVENNLQEFIKFLKSLTPIIFFILVLLIKINIDKFQYRKLKEEKKLEIILDIIYIKKMIIGIIIFALPLIVCIMAFIINKTISLTNIIQSLVIFLAAYFIQKRLFKNID